MGTGTTSYADWACQGSEKNVQAFLDNRAVATGLATFFFDNRVVATDFGISRKALSKMFSWAQARLQMQIGHAMATRNYRLGYIQRNFNQKASMGTGTTSDADWVCHGNKKNLFFSRY